MRIEPPGFLETRLLEYGLLDLLDVGETIGAIPASLEGDHRKLAMVWVAAD
jgi:hypothetical protein